MHSTETLTHDKGGDSLGIASIARYAIQNWGVPKNKVFMLGGSSGAMMTNVMAGAYPDLFVAGAAMAGVPYACFKGTGLWNSDCAQGKIIKTGEQWVSDQSYGGQEFMFLLLNVGRPGSQWLSWVHRSAHSHADLAWSRVSSYMLHLATF